LVALILPAAFSSPQLAPLDPKGLEAAAWSDSRIPNLILRAARDFRPSSARPGAEVSALVLGH